MIEVICTSNSALGKFLVERAVVAEARGDVSPFGKERLIGGAASDIAADAHGAERAAVVTLEAGNHAIARGLSAFEMKLARELDGGFRGFGAAGSEIDAAAGAKVRRRESKEALRQFFGGRGEELRGVREGKLRGLLGHGTTDFGHAVADANDGGLAAGVEEAAASLIDDPAAFAA